MRRMAILSALLWACTKAPPAVLTLAPSAMRSSSGAIANRDGSLDLPRGGVAESTAYADAGTLTLRVSAQALQNAAAVVAIQVNGEPVGELAVDNTAAADTSLDLQIRRRGSQTLRFQANAAPETPAGVPLVRLLKVVIRQ